MIKRLNYRKAVFVAVYSIDKNSKKPIYLLLKRKKHWKGWEFTKGGIDGRETPAQTAKREVKEETGLNIIKLKKYPLTGKYLYEKMFPDRPGIRGQTYTLFSAQVPFGKKVKIDRREHSGYLWFPFDKALKNLTWNNQKKCLRIVNKKIK